MNDWPISVEPTGLPSRMTRLPAAWPGKATWPMPVTASGYRTPQASVSAPNRTSAGRRDGFHGNSVNVDQARLSSDKHHVDQLDADERQQDAADAIDQQVAAQQRGGADGAVLHALERQRNQERR